MERKRKIADDLLERIRKNDPKLKKVNLRSKNLEDVDVIEDLCPALSSNTVVRELYLYDNSLGPLAVRALVDCKLTQLTKLDLSNNNIGDDGVRELVKGDFPVLEELYLGDTGIGNEGVRVLANSNFPALQKLFLWGNKNITELPGSFEGFQSLQYLYIYSCSLTSLPPSLGRLPSLT